ncbi:hypothetical protein ACFUTU_12740 [Arthrobacter sp. NPDC057388]|uniref:hypothetical protein n=1 Tax=Arthrobacter sp. NPDC057388 TaxID=3346116 RepID=UPI003638BC43
MHPRIEDVHLDPGLLPTVDPQQRTDAQLVEPVMEAIQAAVADCSVTAAQVFAGRIHTRKNEECTTAFGRPPSAGHASDGDDFYLQIGVRVPSYAAAPVLKAIRAIEMLSDAQTLREARARLAEARERTAAARSEEARVQAEIDRLDPKRSRP